MNDKHLTCEIQGGVDTTSGHAVDSLFVDCNAREPWAERCFANLIDIIINHQEVLFPTPAKDVRDNLDDSLLPLSFAKAKQFRLISVKADKSADEFPLAPDIMAEEYLNFSLWLLEAGNALKVANWVDYHKVAPRIVRTHNIFVPKHWVDEFWRSRGNDKLSLKVGIPDSDLCYAFDAFARGAQYHKILGGSTPYFSHPLRECALGFLPEIRFLQRHEQWSWGRYFITAIRDNRLPKDIDGILEKVSCIRELVIKERASWYALDRCTPKDRVDLLETIALQCDLPAKLKDSAAKSIKLLLAVGAVASPFIPYPEIATTLSTSLGSLLVALEFKEGYISPMLAKDRAFKGNLVWPGLLRDGR